MIRTDRLLQVLRRERGSVARATTRWSIPLLSIALFMLYFGTQEVHARPTFSSTWYHFTVTENFWSGSRPAVRVGTVTASESGETITYSLEGPDRSRFSIDPTTGVLTTKAGKAISKEHKRIYEVRVKATGDGSESATVLIRVTRVERTETRTLLEMYGHEREPTARNVGTPIPAVTGSTSETFTYSIEDIYAGSMFQIGASSGQLKTKPGQRYNYEPGTGNGLFVYLRVTDSDGVSNLIMVTVNLTDRDEPPRKLVGPCSTEQTATSLTVGWGTGHLYGYPRTESYDLRYRRGKTATQRRGSWTNGEQGIPRTRPQSTISGLEPDTYYEVAIRATSHEGTGNWSTSNCSTRFNRTAAATMTIDVTPAATPPTTSGTTLVSNTGQPAGIGGYTVGGSGSNKWTRAQRFTTGDNADGYTLSAVEVYLEDFGGTDDVKVSIYEANSSGNPVSSGYALTNPSPVANDSFSTRSPRRRVRPWRKRKCTSSWWRRPPANSM